MKQSTRMSQQESAKQTGQSNDAKYFLDTNDVRGGRQSMDPTHTLERVMMKQSTIISPFGRSLYSGLRARNDCSEASTNKDKATQFLSTGYTRKLSTQAGEAKQRSGSKKPTPDAAMLDEEETTRKFVAVRDRVTGSGAPRAFGEDVASMSNEVTSFKPLKDQQTLSVRQPNAVKISRHQLVSLIQTQQTAANEKCVVTRGKVAATRSVAHSTNSGVMRIARRLGSVTRSQNRNGNLLHLKESADMETPSKSFNGSASQRKQLFQSARLYDDAEVTSPKTGAFTLLLPKRLEFRAASSAVAQHGQQDESPANQSQFIMPSFFDASPVTEAPRQVLFVPHAMHQMLQRRQYEKEECMLNDRVKSAQELIGGTTLGTFAKPTNGPSQFKRGDDNSKRSPMFNIGNAKNRVDEQNRKMNKVMEAELVRADQEQDREQRYLAAFDDSSRNCHDDMSPVVPIRSTPAIEQSTEQAVNVDKHQCAPAVSNPVFGVRASQPVTHFNQISDSLRADKYDLGFKPMKVVAFEDDAKSHKSSRAHIQVDDMDATPVEKRKVKDDEADERSALVLTESLRKVQAVKHANEVGARLQGTARDFAGMHNDQKLSSAIQTHNSVLRQNHAINNESNFGEDPVKKSGVEVSSWQKLQDGVDAKPATIESINKQNQILLRPRSKRIAAQQSKRSCEQTEEEFQSSARSLKRRKFDEDENFNGAASKLTDSLQQKKSDELYDSAERHQEEECRDDKQTLNFPSYQQMSSSILKQYSCTPLQPISQSPAEEAAAGPPGPCQFASRKDATIESKLQDRRVKKLTAKQQAIIQQTLDGSQGDVLNQIQQVQIRQHDLAAAVDRRVKFMPLNAINSIPTRKHGHETAFGEGQDQRKLGSAEADQKQSIGNFADPAHQPSSFHALKEVVSLLHRDPAISEVASSSNLYSGQTVSMGGLQFDEAQKNLIRHQMLNPHLYKRGPTKYQKQQIQTEPGKNQKPKGHWTEDEDRLLTEAVREFAGKSWKSIAKRLPGRTDVQCLHRWQKVLNPTLVKGPWTDIEDRLLLHIVNLGGPQKWTNIAQHLPGRIGKQCRERWHNHLNPMIKRNAQWTVEEEWILFLLNRDKANKWADIANILEGRTDNTIKNHWNSSMKRRIQIYRDEFDELFKKKLNQQGMKFRGSTSVEVDDDGEHLLSERERKAGVKKLPKEYITNMKDLEQDLLDQKSQLVKEQNRLHYQNKCIELLESAEADSFCLAAATIMLNSGSEYLVELREKYQSILERGNANSRGIQAGTVAVNEKQLTSMIDKICSASSQQDSKGGAGCARSPSDQDVLLGHISKGIDEDADATFVAPRSREMTPSYQVNHEMGSTMGKNAPVAGPLPRRVINTRSPNGKEPCDEHLIRQQQEPSLDDNRLATATMNNYSDHKDQGVGITRNGYMYRGNIDNSLKRSPELSSDHYSAKMHAGGLPQGRICAFTAGDLDQRRAREAMNNGARLQVRKDSPQPLGTNITAAEAEGSTAKRESGVHDRYASGFLGMQGKHLFTDSPAPDNDIIPCSSGSAQSLEDRAARGRRRAIDDRSSIQKFDLHLGGGDNRADPLYSRQIDQEGMHRGDRTMIGEDDDELRRAAANGEPRLDEQACGRTMRSMADLCANIPLTNNFQGQHGMHYQPVIFQSLQNSANRHAAAAGQFFVAANNTAPHQQQHPQQYFIMQPDGTIAQLHAVPMESRPQHLMFAPPSAPSQQAEDKKD